MDKRIEEIPQIMGVKYNMKVKEKYVVYFKHGLQEGILAKQFEDKFFPAVDSIRQQGSKAFMRMFGANQAKTRQEVFIDAFELGYNKSDDLLPHLQQENLKQHCITKGFLQIT